MSIDSPGPCAGKITISRVTEEKCTLAWRMPQEDGGAEITHYIVERRETSRLNWVIVEPECPTLSCVVTRLIKNNEYIFRVRAVNKYGPGVPLETEPIIARNSFSKYFSSLVKSFPFGERHKVSCVIHNKCEIPNSFPAFNKYLQLSHHHLVFLNQWVLAKSTSLFSG